jgi:hypothetical protein
MPNKFYETNILILRVWDKNTRRYVHKKIISRRTSAVTASRSMPRGKGCTDPGVKINSQVGLVKRSNNENKCDTSRVIMWHFVPVPILFTPVNCGTALSQTFQGKIRAQLWTNSANFRGNSANFRGSHHVHNDQNHRSLKLNRSVSTVSHCIRNTTSISHAFNA